MRSLAAIREGSRFGIGSFVVYAVLVRPGHHAVFEGRTGRIIADAADLGPAMENARRVLADPELVARIKAEPAAPSIDDVWFYLDPRAGKVRHIYA